MPVVSARDIHKAYGSRTLLEGVSLTVQRRERVGLLGANGAGKSTLLRILAGIEQPDAGVVETRREASVRYLAQEPALDPAASARQIVERGLSAWYAKTSRHRELSVQLERATPETLPALLAEQGEVTVAIEQLGGWSRDRFGLELLGHLGVRDVDRAVGTFSGGERRRVALAELLVSEPTLAILDEPTNHLDVAAIEWLEGYLADDFPGAVVLVTHDRYVLDAVAERVLELDSGKVTQFTGGYEGYLEQKAELLAHAERVEQNRLNLLRREKAWLERGAKARSTKQKARVKRAEALLEVKARKEVDRVDFSGMDGGSPRLGKTILDLEELAFEIGGRRLLDGLTLKLVKGERIGILGVNGAGKTSLLKLVAGELTPSSGRVVLGANTKVVYFDQARSNLDDDWSVFDNVAERKGADRSPSEVVRIGDQVLEMRTYLEQFLFDGTQQRQKVGALSGGERARVALAKALKTGANLLLLDEPTNDLDVSTLGALEELLASWPGCALIVSHDRYFLDRVATATLAFEGDGVVTPYQGGYATYRSLKAQADAAEGERKRAEEAERRTSPELPPAAAPAIAGTPKKPLTFAERKELDGILDEIALLEETVAALEARLSDPALYAAGAEEAQAVRQAHARESARLAERTARWEALEERRDARR